MHRKRALGLVKIYFHLLTAFYTGRWMTAVNSYLPAVLWNFFGSRGSDAPNRSSVRSCYEPEAWVASSVEPSPLTALSLDSSLPLYAFLRGTESPHQVQSSKDRSGKKGFFLFFSFKFPLAVQVGPEFFNSFSNKLCLFLGRIVAIPKISRGLRFLAKYFLFLYLSNW